MGELFGGRYELVDALAAGGAGTVWRAWDHRDRAYCAAKVLRQSDSDSLLRFMRETTRHIDHPHVMAPRSWTGEDDRILFTMPLVRGGSVDTLLRDFGTLPLGWSIELTRQSLLALSEVHALGLVHRDVKPGNLMLEQTGTGQPHLMLSDFGAAAQVGAPRLTQADSVIGTPGYFAPEQLRGADPSPTQDIYAAGVVMLQMLTGVTPSRSGELPRAPRVDSTSTAVADLVERMTAEVEVRPGTAVEVLAVLDAIPGSHDLSLGSDQAAPVEVFDQVPVLPAGWDEAGPVGSSRVGSSRVGPSWGSEPAADAWSASRPSPGSAQPAQQMRVTTMLPRDHAGAAVSNQPSARRPSRRPPALVWLLLVLGALLIALAFLIG